jgi:hypothetical protein
MNKLLREDKSNKPDFTYFAELYKVSERLVKRFKEGEKKYARLNWRNCKDPQTYKESAIRHFMQYLDNQTDEDHIAAATVNLMILMDLENKE